MRYILAGIVSVFLIVGMFVFMFIMASKANMWEERGVDLSGIELVLLQSSLFISNYGLILVPCIIAACFGVAVCLPKNKNPQ